MLAERAVLPTDGPASPDPDTTVGMEVDRDPVHLDVAVLDLAPGHNEPFGGSQKEHDLVLHEDLRLGDGVGVRHRDSRRYVALFGRRRAGLRCTSSGP